jgi:S-adenosylmethionine-diacylglycerol 3-amino-3-carboxypropyl transferase
VNSWLFDQIQRRNLVYNQCWEDPAIDKVAVRIEPADRIVMITSAGCNALDYLLSDPERIDCVDVNPHQTALLELKLGALRELPYWDFFEMFGTGRIAGYRRIYGRHLRNHLSASSRQIWDRRIHYFDPAGGGLYFHGTSGLFARILNWHIQRRGTLRQDLEYLQTIQHVRKQGEFYQRKIAPQLWSPFLRWILRRRITMSLLGVPNDQIQNVRGMAKSDLSTFIEERVERVFTRVPIHVNYFWRVYINGRYTPDCCPNYLKEKNFEILRARAGRIHTHTMTLADFLKFSEQEFSIYVLLDHMDWLANSGEMLQAEWQAILKTAKPGARIIYRSGGASFNHIPEFALKRIELQADLAEALHAHDRVGTYGSFHLANVLPMPS